MKLGCLACVLFALALIPTVAEAAGGEAGPCDRLAAAAGNDAASGAPATPVRTIARLLDVTPPGSVACLAAGETFSELANLNAGGTQTAPIILTSAPGSPAVIEGQVRFVGSHVHVTRVDFAGLGSVADSYPKTYHLGVDGDDVHIEYADITSPRGMCVDVGEIDAYGGTEGAPTVDFELSHSRVHGCGLQNLAAGELTREDSGIHGVNLKHTLAARIVDDAIYDNADRGIQLWPDADSTAIEHDTLSGNGSNLNLGSYALNGFFSEANVVGANIIVNSVLRSCAACDVPSGDTAQIVGNFPAGTGAFGNVVEHNCIYERDPSRNFEGLGFEQTQNVFLEPVFTDAANGDFTLASGSMCEGLGVDSAVAPAHGSATPAREPAPAASESAAGQSSQKIQAKMAPVPATERPCPRTGPRKRRQRGLSLLSARREGVHTVRLKIRVRWSGLLHAAVSGASSVTLPVRDGATIRVTLWAPAGPAQVHVWLRPRGTDSVTGARMCLPQPPYPSTRSSSSAVRSERRAVSARRRAVS
jgi:hypothetical protein